MARAHWTDDDVCDLVLDEDWHAIQAAGRDLGLADDDPADGHQAEAGRDQAEGDDQADQADDPLAVRCGKCGAPAGKPCRTYRGHRKPTCKTRGQRLPPDPDDLAPPCGSLFSADDIPD
jgi:hypothetical protein